MVRLEFPHPDGREIEKNVEKNLKLRGLVSGWILSLCHYVTMSMPRRIRKFHLKNCILSLPPRLLDLETQKTEKEKKERDIIKKNAPTYVVAVGHCVLYKFLLGFASSWCSFKTTRVFFLSPSRRKAQNRRGRRRQCSDVAW